MNISAKIVITAICLGGLAATSGCAPVGTNTANGAAGNSSGKTNSAANVNSNSNSNPAAANSMIDKTNPAAASMAIDTREPDKYQAKVTLKIETMGDGSSQMPAGMPNLTANVARSGDSRRMEFALPTGEKIIYLDRGGKQMLIMPDKKQYADLNKDSTGFDVRRMLTPQQIVAQVGTIKGTERVGEEVYNGRPAIKYLHKSVADSKSQAGNVATDSTFYIDKETGLPLHSETTSESSGSVKGLKGIRLVTELGDIKTSVDETLFAEPTEFTKVESEQVKQQVNLIFNVATQLLLQQLQTAPPTESPKN